MFRGSYEADYTDSLLFLAGGVYSAFALWGLACLLEDVRDSKTWVELITKLKRRLKKKSNDISRDSN